MLKHILIAGGAIALTAAPAYAGAPSSGSGGLLQCLGCSGLLKPGGGGSPISAGNLNAKVKASVSVGVKNNSSNLLNVSAKAGAHGKSSLSAALKVKAQLPSVNLGGGDCK